MRAVSHGLLPANESVDYGEFEKLKALPCFGRGVLPLIAPIVAHFAPQVAEFKADAMLTQCCEHLASVLAASGGQQAQVRHNVQKAMVQQGRSTHTGLERPSMLTPMDHHPLEQTWGCPKSPAQSKIDKCLRHVSDASPVLQQPCGVAGWDQKRKVTRNCGGSHPVQCFCHCGACLLCRLGCTNHVNLYFELSCACL